MSTIAPPAPPASPPIEAPVSTPPQSESPWIYRPWLDLMVGCGAWSAPLLLLVAFEQATHTRAWTMAFYALALVFNYPHFMATVYRAYHTREEFHKYRLFTLHFAVLLALTAAVLHLDFRLLPWIFTLYIGWSPWHYSGQNFGLLMMFARRARVAPAPAERRALHWAFIASYALLLVGFHTGPSNDPLILSLNLPRPVAATAQAILGTAFAGLGGFAFWRLSRRAGLRALVAPATLFITQLLWFVLPTILQFASGVQIPQTRYSSGILAILHSAQYLWITSYYARREARAAGEPRWRPFVYFATLVAGGIALFIPGPWLVSYAFHFDFTTSFLIFTALVNIHHFVLDGAIWKLRDSRIAAMLLNPQPSAVPGMRAESVSRGVARWLAGSAPVARAFRVGIACLFFLWGEFDLARDYFVTGENSLASLHLAGGMNSYDSAVNIRIAKAEARAGNIEEALAALNRSVAVNPANPVPQELKARFLVEQHDYAAAYAQYRKLLEVAPHNADALVSYGLLAQKFDHPDEAIRSWQAAIAADPKQLNARLFLGDLYDRQQQPALVAEQYGAFLQFVAAHPEQHSIPRPQILSVLIKLADLDAQLHKPAEAVRGYQAAIQFAGKIGDPAMESLALTHLADLEENAGDPASAARSYQRALALDASSSDSRAAAIDWFNYGQFLRRRKQLARLAYACLLRSEDLLESTPGPEFDAVRKARQEVETVLGRQAKDVRANVQEESKRAASLPESAFSP